MTRAKSILKYKILLENNHVVNKIRDLQNYGKMLFPNFIKKRPENSKFKFISTSYHNFHHISVPN